MVNIVGTRYPICKECGCKTKLKKLGRRFFCPQCYKYKTFEELEFIDEINWIRI